jgi:hypothetical protein
LEALSVAHDIDDEGSRAKALLRSARQLGALGRAREALGAAKESFQTAAAIEAPEGRSLACSRSAMGLLDLGETVEARRAIEARLTALQCQVPEDRLKACAAILEAYGSRIRDPQLSSSPK